MTFLIILTMTIPIVALVVLLGDLSARTKSIKVTSPLGQVLIEFGLTQDEVEVEKLRLLVALSSQVSDAEFRTRALVVLRDYLGPGTAAGVFDLPPSDSYRLPAASSWPRAGRTALPPPPPF